MQCPLDGTELLITFRNDVEIDYCPKCRGVWLDRGELDKLLDRAKSWDDDDDDDDDRRYKDDRSKPKSDSDDRRKYDEDDDRRRYEKRKRKPGSFLEDLFDF